MIAYQSQIIRAKLICIPIVRYALDVKLIIILITQISYTSFWLVLEWHKYCCVWERLSKILFPSLESYNLWPMWIQSTNNYSNDGVCVCVCVCVSLLDSVQIKLLLYSMHKKCLQVYVAMINALVNKSYGNFTYVCWMTNFCQYKFL